MRALYFLKGLGKWLVLNTVFAFVLMVVSGGCLCMGESEIPNEKFGLIILGFFAVWFVIGLIPCLSIYFIDIKNHGVETASQGKIF
jgi:hypothetical protein